MVDGCDLAAPIEGELIGANVVGNDSQSPDVLLNVGIFLALYALGRAELDGASKGPSGS